MCNQNFIYFYKKKLTMKKSIFLVVATLLMTIFMEAQTKQSIHQFKVKDLNGKTFDFATLKGKKILVVNTASNVAILHNTNNWKLFIKNIKAKIL